MVARSFSGISLRRRMLSIAGDKETDLTVLVRANDGRELIRYTPPVKSKAVVPPPRDRAAIAAQDRVERRTLSHRAPPGTVQARDPAPEDYWSEALRRDPADSRCNNAMGGWRLRRGEFAEAEECFRRAVAAITRRNPNPYDGEPYFHLGVALRYQGKYEEAYSAFYKATWNQAWQSAGYHAVAELDARRGDWRAALDHLDRALRLNTDHLKARNLKAIALRHLGREEEAGALIEATLALDPLDDWAHYLPDTGWIATTRPAWISPSTLRAPDCTPMRPPSWLRRTCRRPTAPRPGLVHPRLPACLRRGGLRGGACYSSARRSPPDYCFPNRLEEIAILENARRTDPAIPGRHITRYPSLQPAAVSRSDRSLGEICASGSVVRRRVEEPGDWLLQCAARSAESPPGVRPGPARGAGRRARLV